MCRNSKHHSLAAQFIGLLLLSGLLCGLLFFVLHSTVETALGNYFAESDFQQTATEKRISQFQEYVAKNQLAVTDKDAITRWVKKEPLILMEIYRSNVLVFTSYAPESENVEQNNVEVPYYDWVSYYVVDFADGSAEVLLYCDDAFQYFTYATITEVVICALLFLIIFLLGCKKIVRYIRQISKEIQAMESGDLDSQITIQGNNDLTTLAEGLDAMRLAFREQQEQEAQTYAANQALISEMSHDLRTPLTTLLIYTEILRYQKYQGDEQLRDYLNKIDAKARQIKQLSENILEYSLVTKEHAVELEAPLHAQDVFESPLYEAMTYLVQYGYMCKTEIHWETSMVSVCTQYIRRIMDNIVSNILKYAELNHPVQIQAEEKDGEVRLSFENVILQKPQKNGGTCIGLSSIHTMMEKMHGNSYVEQTEKTFKITLVFPKVKYSSDKDATFEGAPT